MLLGEHELNTVNDLNVCVCGDQNTEGKNKTNLLSLVKIIVQPLPCVSMYGTKKVSFHKTSGGGSTQIFYLSKICNTIV